MAMKPRIRLMRDRLRDEQGTDLWIRRTDTYSWDKAKLIDAVGSTCRILLHDSGLNLVDLGVVSRDRLSEFLDRFDSTEFDLTLYGGVESSVVVVEARH